MHETGTIVFSFIYFNFAQILLVCKSQHVFMINNILIYIQWVPRESSAPITHATFSCDSQLVYASFLDATVCVFSASNLRLRCRINPTAYLPANVRYVSNYMNLHVPNICCFVIGFVIPFI